ncbi:GIY-YIG nuclease family protein [Streptomyces lycii]|uniref:GIY-YIG nuclease family protein n=1 Tax=Streptomyces lycii TaxID=2654337 RepID=A0ABQ7FI05_9ACTN|nr:GIY-YIG nuclease family protein [Streptomyces lycii]KAF4408624.1 GIY-YIG nuclease family protein [Streptomyces lycii]
MTELGGTVLEQMWLGSPTPHRVRCAEGHETTTRPNSVQRGKGICRYCAGQTWDAFYVVRDPDTNTVKFGITSGDPRPRLRTHAADGLTDVIRLHTDMPGTAAPDLERRIINALRDAGETPVRGREYYPARVLATVLDIADGALRA